MRGAMAEERLARLTRNKLKGEAVKNMQVWKQCGQGV